MKFNKKLMIIWVVCLVIVFAIIYQLINWEHASWIKEGCGAVPTRTDFLTSSGNEFEFRGLYIDSCMIIGTMKTIHGPIDTMIPVNDLWVPYEN